MHQAEIGFIVFQYLAVNHFMVLHNWSSGSGGTWSSLTLFYDSNTLPKKGDGQYVMAGQLFPDPPQPGWRCE